jgi:hypothetical protein
MEDLEKMLNAEITLNKKEPWNKLDKTRKLNRLNTYAKVYCNNNNIENVNKLQTFLRNKLNQKRLLNCKEVIYDTIKQQITDIPSLIYTNNTFVLKRYEKRHPTTKSLTPSKKKIDSL